MVEGVRFALGAGWVWGTNERMTNTKQRMRTWRGLGMRSLLPTTLVRYWFRFDEYVRCIRHFGDVTLWSQPLSRHIQDLDRDKAYLKQSISRRSKSSSNLTVLCVTATQPILHTDGWF